MTDTATGHAAGQPGAEADRYGGAGFRYRGDALYAEGVALADIAAQCGSPCYVYSRAAIEQAYTSFGQALDGVPHRICYAVKANGNLAILQVLARLGAGFDVVSGGELERVLRAGGDPARVIFSGVGKTADELGRALAVGIGCINVESPAELDTLEAVAAAAGKVAPVGIRVNPDVDARTHPYISTGLKENKFGVAADQAITLAARVRASRHLDLQGIGCHIGSQITDLAPLREAFASVLALAERIEQDGPPLKHLDLGGGLGVRYRDETPIPIEQYARAIKRLLENRRDLLLTFEPGRRIVAHAGVLLTRVQYLKQQGAKQFAVVDAAMNDLIRPALYQAWHSVLPVDKGLVGRRAEWDIVGPVCESGDFLARERVLSLSAGHLLAVGEAGAYGFVMSSNYNTRCRAAEVLVDGTQFTVVRRRETVDDLLALESLLPDGAGQQSSQH